MLRKSTRNRVLDGAVLLAALLLAAGLSGCRVQVDKDARGQDKKVQVDTPFGGIHVNTDQTTAADLGLPAYPGAQIVRDRDNNQSADVHMGFGEWNLRVRAVSYESSDSQDKVAAYYKKALGRYGDVISCQDGAPVGAPKVTSEGLTCSDKGGANLQFSDQGTSYGYHSTPGGFQLKAGSKRHQHLVGFKSAAPGHTSFALIALDLPSGFDSDSGKSD